VPAGKKPVRKKYDGKKNTHKGHASEPRTFQTRREGGDWGKLVGRAES